MLITDEQADFSVYLAFLDLRNFQKSKRNLKRPLIQKANGAYNLDHLYGLRRKAFFFGAGIMSRNFPA
jgi:bifunctional pyridoxal-dependent enzyme with beta-cystathionase and maltose regulon repressor activities